eukprot:TRINITY_DN599_c0_g1_i2.p1 TRINITY_DN599_c0_g1~~TRINITY_DN599_c0_g1_i2.p1  ORF type:complete len:148 (-),score=25.48 TRINITY_DN599_c0_g1_i2:133-576(-)
MFSGVRMAKRAVFRAGFRFHGGALPKMEDRTLTVTFINKDGTRTPVKAAIGQNLLHVAQANGIEMEGACEASLACSTCHVIVSQDQYDSLPPPCEEEDDMLDLAFGLTETSRLGCQVVLDQSMDGLVVALPRATRNMAVDGYVPQPH